jgi:uncharacterized protein (TIRG00374 family)
MKRFLLQWVLPGGLTVFFLALSFHWIQNPREIPHHIAGVPLHIHALFIAITLFSMWLRAVRWAALLPGRGLTGRRCFGPIMIGFMMNSLLPARAGEFARSIALGRKERLSITSVFGSVVLERVFDGVVLMASFAMILLLLGAHLPESVSFGGRELTRDQMRAAVYSTSLLAAVLLALIVAVLIPGPRQLLERIFRLCLPERISAPLIGQMEKLISGFHALHSPRAIFTVLGWTVSVWAAVALSVWVASFGFPQLHGMGYLQAWAVVVFVCVAITLPASPGYWGLYELGVIVALKALGLTEDAGLAFSYSVVMHVWQIVPNLIIGLGFLWAEGLRLGQLAKIDQVAEMATHPEG